MLEPADIAFYLSVFKDLELIDIMQLATLAKVNSLKAGEVYIKEGAISHTVAYIKSGLIRCYAIQENGDEATLMLRWENQFIASVDTVVYQQPARFTYHALEDSVLLEIDYRKAQSIIDQNPKLSASRNSFLLLMLGQAVARVESFVLLSPQERYLKLLAEKPDIANRVPDKYLATLLGITPVSLSRIRKRIASPGKTGSTGINNGLSG